MKKIIPIDYKKSIINKFNNVYKSFVKNYSQDFIAPENIVLFFKNNNQLIEKEGIEKFGKELEKTFNQWKPIDENLDKVIILNNLMSIIQNCLISMILIDKNLEKQNLKNDVIDSSEGMDVLITTCLQAVGVKLNEIINKYKALNLDQDETHVYKSFINFITNMANQSFTEAVTSLVQNVLEFNREYNDLYLKLSHIEEDKLSFKRHELFIEIINSYYLLAFFLELILIYPLNEGLLEESIFKKMIEDINLY